jgi:urea carboxylase
VIDGAGGDRGTPLTRDRSIKAPRRVLIANRGEIACRIVRTLRRMGVGSVAVYSEADSGAAHVLQADIAVPIGPAPVAESYLSIEKILAAARATESDAIHPGYGLLSEKAEFAAACEAAGVAFIGPTAEQIRAFGEKHRARELAEKAGVPVCPGSGLLATPGDAVVAATALGFPILLKATAGGGGIGMRLCRDADETRREFEQVQRLAGAHFGSTEVFAEKRIPRARHVEVQIFGDGAGGVVSLGERDCSLQRRRQKVFEEAPSFGLDPALVAQLNRAAVDLAVSVRFRSAGTVEFLVDPEANTFYFLEVNTRLQVEHGVTEEISGIDLVEWMIRLAGGDAAAVHAYEHRPRGHAIEIRLYAEDPGREFQPSTGRLTDVEFPADVRVDGWVVRGTEVTPFYDPLLAKVVAHGADRADAIRKLAAALARTRLAGVQTNLPYARKVLEWPEFREARHHTNSLAALEFHEECVEVVAPGAMTTVQDYPGRLGYWDVGVPPSGPMDDLSFRLGNRIVGNAGGAAGLEITINGPTLRFRRAALICLAGATIRARLDGVEVPPWRPVGVAANSTLDLGSIDGPGARTYLLVRGGLDVPPYLGSRSTFALGGFGGHCGRALRPGDVLRLGDASDLVLAPDVALSAQEAEALSIEYAATWDVRVLDGPHAAPEFFTDDDIRRFYSDGFEVHYQSARTGVRLIGPKPKWTRGDGGDAGLHPSNIHDTAYGVGSIDYTGDMPVILGPDGPSLGGFVCPAVIIQADLWKTGQFRSGDRVRFRSVTLDEAVEARRVQEQWIAQRGTAPHGVGVARADVGLASPQSSGIIGRTERHRVETRHDLPEVTYRQSGDRYLLVEYGPMTLDIDLRIRVQLLLSVLRERMADGALHGVIDLTPGIRSLQIHHDPVVLPRGRLLSVLESVEDDLPSGENATLPTRIVHMPLSWNDPATQEAIRKYMEVVRDDAPWCPSNIEFIRRINGLDGEEDVKRIVFGASYLVLGLGDVYLGAPVATPMDPRHRLVTTKYNPARTWTPENAVGIGGAYMCVYGMEGPGGYQFVGRTVPVWSTYPRWRGATENEPWLLRFFDQIRFFPIEAGDLHDYRRGVREGRIALKIEETALDIAAYHEFLAANRVEIESFRKQQQAAFAAERQRWVEAGEFEASERAMGGMDAGQEPAAPFELGEGEEVVAAPLGAQVWRVSVDEGALVEEGDELVVLSAMKTETAVPAPRGGRVTRILCKTGDVVSAGAPLCILRAELSE